MREEERGVALRLVHARTPTSGTHVTRPDRYALPKFLSLFHPRGPSLTPVIAAFLFSTPFPLFSASSFSTLLPASPSFFTRFPLRELPPLRRPFVRDDYASLPPRVLRDAPCSGCSP